MPTPSRIDWEAFYRRYREPGYIPGFEILHKIGGGSFGLVFKARKESIAKDYAIKFLKVDDEGVRDAILSELRSVGLFAQIDHPNLVSIEDKGEVDGIPFIVMNYAGEETLRQRLDAGPLPREEGLRLFGQVCRGLAALHDHSLVHFDLKPANIFLKGNHARLGDYGLSKLVSQSRNSLSMGRGTPYYMAPEQLQRRGDHRSDIYSLGVLLFEVLTGQVPFQGDSEWEVLRKHEKDRPEIPDSVGHPERQIIARCLAKRPEDRFTAVTEILAMLGNDPIDVEPTPLAPPPIPADAGDPPPPVPTVVTPEDTPVSRNGDHERRNAKRRKQPSNSRVLLFTVVALSIVFGLGVAVNANYNSKRERWAAGQKALASAPTAIVAHVPAPPAAPEASAGWSEEPSVEPTSKLVGKHFHPLAYPSLALEALPMVRTSIASLPEVADDEDARLRIFKRLRRDRYKTTAIVHAVNEMLDLDPLSRTDQQTQRQLDELLARLTGDEPQQRALEGLSKAQLRTEHDRILEHWWHHARKLDESH